MTAYLDVTVALPIMAAYVVQTTKAKKQKRLYNRSEELREKLIQSYLKNNKFLGKHEELIRKLGD